MHKKYQLRNETTTRLVAPRILVCGALCLLLGAGLSVAGTPDGFSLSGRHGEPAISAGDGVCPVRYAVDSPSEYEPEQSAAGAVRYSAVDSEEAMPAKGTSDAKPLWLTLSDMNPAERQNAHISFEAFDTGNIALLDRLKQAADLWNGGDTSTAVTIVRTLEDAGRSFAVGISWKAPRGPAKMNSTAVGSHGSAHNPHLDGHKASGNVFIAIEDADGGDFMRVYFSSDGGGTWAETWSAHVAGGNTILDISGVVVGDYFYVTYAVGSIPGSAWVLRIHASTGIRDMTFNTTGSIEAFDSTPNDIVELQLTSNQDDNNNRLYLFSILSNDTLALLVTDEDGGDGSLAWTPVVTGVTNAADNLDVAYNAGNETGDTILFAIYRVIGVTTDRIHALRINTAMICNTTDLSRYYGSSDLHISAYRNEVMAVYEYSNGGTSWILYGVSFNGGGLWYEGILDNGSEGNCYQPNVTLRRGGGVVVAYQRDLVGDDLIFMLTRPYTDTYWSTPAEVVTDADLSLGTAVELQALPKGGPGVIWFSFDNYAHFDQTERIWRNSFENGDTVDWD